MRGGSGNNNMAAENTQEIHSQLNEYEAGPWARQQEVTNTCSTAKLKATIAKTNDVHVELNKKYNRLITQYQADLNRGQDINETLTTVTGDMISFLATFAKQNNIPTKRPIGDFLVDRNAIIPIDDALLMVFGPTVLTDVSPHRVEAIAREIREVGRDRASLIELTFQELKIPEAEMMRPNEEKIEEIKLAYNNLLIALREREDMRGSVISIVLSDDTVIDIKITEGDYKRELEFIKFYAFLKYYDKEARLFISGLTQRFNGTLQRAIEGATHAAAATGTTASLAIANPLNTALNLIHGVYNFAAKDIPETVTTMYTNFVDFLTNVRVEDMEQLGDLGRPDISDLSIDQLFQRLKALNTIKFQCLAEANILYLRNLRTPLQQATDMVELRRGHSHDSRFTTTASSHSAHPIAHLPAPPGSMSSSSAPHAPPVGVYSNLGFGTGAPKPDPSEEARRKSQQKAAAKRRRYNRKGRVKKPSPY